MGYPAHQQETRSSAIARTAMVLVALVAVVVFGRLAVWAFFSFAADSEHAVAVEEVGFLGPYDVEVEIDQHGQTYIDRKPVPLDQIRVLLQNVRRDYHGEVETPTISVVENCPFEHVEKVLAVFREANLPAPHLQTVPPYRILTVELDAKGNATLANEPAEDVENALQQISDRHGHRASVTVRVHPQCPASAVIAMTNRCGALNFGDVRIVAMKSDTRAAAPSSAAAAESSE